MAKSLRFLLILFAVAAVATLVGALPNFDKTLEVQRQLAAERPGDPTVHNDLGNLFVLARQNESAEAAYLRALELDPNSAAVRFNLALLLQQTGRLREAEEQYQEVLAADPRHAWSYYQLGVINEQRRQRSKAIELYARAFALDAQLSFSTYNPHVIENRLLTQALLATDRYLPPAAADVPLLYGETERLQALLAEGTEEAAAAKQAADGGDDSATGDGAAKLEADGEGRGEGEGNRVLTKQDLEPGSQLGKVTGSSGGGNVRTMGQSTGGRSAVRNRTGTSSTVRRYTPPSARREDGRGTTAPSAPLVGVVPRGASGHVQEKSEAEDRAGDDGRFRPSTRSTGQLDLELLPEQPVPERLASFAPPAGR